MVKKKSKVPDINTGTLFTEKDDGTFDYNHVNSKISDNMDIDVDDGWGDDAGDEFGDMTANDDTSNYNLDQDDGMVVPNNQEQGEGYLHLMLSNDLREVELYIRGLHLVTRNNSETGKPETKMEKVKNHFLNSVGVNAIIREIQANTGKISMLGYITEYQFNNITDHFGRSIIKFVYRNLDEFGANTREKQASIRPLLTTIINAVHSTFSRSINGRENRASRGNISINGSLDGNSDTFDERRLVKPKGRIKDVFS